MEHLDSARNLPLAIDDIPMKFITGLWLSGLDCTSDMSNFWRQRDLAPVGQDGLTGSAWGDWANYTDSPLRAFEDTMLGEWSKFGHEALRHCGFWVDWWMVIVLVVRWIHLLLHAITPVTLSLLCTSNIKKTKKVGLIGNLGHIKPKLWLHHPPPTVQQVVEENNLTPSIWQISFDANGRNLH